MISWGIVLAAGSGVRFGEPKHELKIGGRAAWQRAVDALEQVVNGVVVVGPVANGVRGGQRRRDSVRAGLDRLPAECTHVLVHDAARPLASADLARRVLERLSIGDVDGVVPCLPMSDTLKIVDGERIIETADRSRFVTVQTPQGFVVSALIAAHDGSHEDSTDDAALVERNGGVVVTVAGESANIKVTTPADLALVRSLA